jgi:hypothetical protein
MVLAERQDASEEKSVGHFASERIQYCTRRC